MNTLSWGEFLWCVHRFSLLILGIGVIQFLFILIKNIREDWRDW